SDLSQKCVSFHRGTRLATVSFWTRLTRSRMLRCTVGVRDGSFWDQIGRYCCPSIGLILIQELTFLRSAKQRAREARAPFHAAPSSFSSGHHLEDVADLQLPDAG